MTEDDFDPVTLEQPVIEIDGVVYSIEEYLLKQIEELGGIPKVIITPEGKVYEMPDRVVLGLPIEKMVKFMSLEICLLYPKRYWKSIML